jgi:Ala-tRNA(Pro) deacylase
MSAHITVGGSHAWPVLLNNPGMMHDPDAGSAPDLAPGQQAGRPPHEVTDTLTPLTEEVGADDALAPLTRRLIDLLQTQGVAHRAFRHRPVLTSEEASRVRGTPLEAGAKALVCHADDRTVLIVVPADARLDNRAFRQQAGVRNVRMIDAERIEALVGAPVGAVPPFGSLFGLPTYADEEVVGRDLIAFNAGARDVSVTMRGPDYAALERPTVGRYARRASQ